MTLRRQRTLCRPPAFKSSPDCLDMQSTFSAPRGNALCPAIDRNTSSISFVFGLLLACCPHAVIRLVVSVVIASINRVLQRRLPAHVCKEVLKLRPSLADANTASTIFGKVLTIGVVAPSQHCCPRSIFRSSVLAMFRVCGSRDGGNATSTRFCVAAAKTNACYDRFSPAPANRLVAKATPLSLFMLRRSVIFQHAKESPWTSAGHVFDLVSAFDTLARSHDVNLQLGLRMVRADAGCILRSARFIVPERLCLS